MLHLGHRQVAHQDGLEDEHHRKRAREPYGSGQRDMLQDRNTAERNKDDSADVSEDRQQSRRQHEVSSCGACGVLVTQSIKLVMVAALPLNTVTHIAGCQDKRNNQHDRVEVVFHYANEPETPHGREEAGHYRCPPAAALTARKPQDQNHHADCDQEQHADGRFVVVTVAADDWLARDQDIDVRILVLLDDILDLVEQRLIVQAKLIERRLDYGALQVGTDILRNVRKVG